ncbi:MAG: matrixin family metalloprotease [Candidatus Methanoperedens sp.]|nr:matrixin family metalloprotease [Candidatus Methanoperedens sp.]
MKQLDKSLFLAIVILTLAITASAHFLGHSAVDNMEIRYGGSTQYTTAQSHSFSTWNALGKVNIAPDTIWTYEDVTYGDYYDSSTNSAFAYYWYNPLGSDDIKFNQYRFDQFTTSEQKKTATHELGHALGLNHSYYPNVMVQGQYSLTQLGSHDIQDYNTLYP